MHGSHCPRSCGDPLTPLNLLKVLGLGLAQELEELVQLHSVHGSVLAHGLGLMYLGFRISPRDLVPGLVQGGLLALLGLKVLISVSKLGFRNLYLRQAHQEVGQTGPLTVVSDVLGILGSTLVILSQRARPRTLPLILFQGSLILVPLVRLIYSWTHMRAQWTPPRNLGQGLSFLILVAQESYRGIPLLFHRMGWISSPVVSLVLLMELVQELIQTLVVAYHCVREPRTQSWGVVGLQGLILALTHMTRAQILVSHSDNGYLICADRSWYGAIKTLIYLGSQPWLA